MATQTRLINWFIFIIFNIIFIHYNIIIFNTFFCLMFRLHQNFHHFNVILNSLIRNFKFRTKLQTYSNEWVWSETFYSDFFIRNRIEVCKIFSRILIFSYKFYTLSCVFFVVWNFSNKMMKYLPKSYLLLEPIFWTYVFR